VSWASVLSAAGYWDGGDMLHVPTSGTSDGAARVVVRTVASWTESFDPFTAATGIDPADVVVAAGPSTSLFVYARAHAAAVGAQTVVDARWHPSRLAGGTVAHLTPTMLHDILDDGVPRSWTRSLRLVVVAGSALSPGLRERAVGRGLDVVEYYGAAELSFVALGRGALRPFPQVEVDVRDEVLWVRSPWTALGYAHEVSGPLRRDGDWCTVWDRGHVVDGAVVVDGRDGLVLTGGVAVRAADVEAVLRAAPGVLDCAVVGVPHDRLGEVVAAVVVGGERSEVVDRCRDLLPRRLRPVLWYAADRLPSTAAGKVAVVDLRRAILDGEVSRWR
jgi:long-chain acyl-CoA synthetase